MTCLVIFLISVPLAFTAIKIRRFSSTTKWDYMYSKKKRCSFSELHFYSSARLKFCHFPLNFAIFCRISKKKKYIYI